MCMFSYGDTCDKHHMQRCRGETRGKARGRVTKDTFCGGPWTGSGGAAACNHDGSALDGAGLCATTDAVTAVLLEKRLAGAGAGDALPRNESTAEGLGASNSRICA